MLEIGSCYVSSLCEISSTEGKTLILQLGVPLPGAANEDSFVLPCTVWVDVQNSPKVVPLIEGNKKGVIDE